MAVKLVSLTCHIVSHLSYTHLSPPYITNLSQIWISESVQTFSLMNMNYELTSRISFLLPWFPESIMKFTWDSGKFTKAFIPLDRNCLIPQSIRGCKFNPSSIGGLSPPKRSTSLLPSHVLTETGSRLFIFSVRVRVLFLFIYLFIFSKVLS